MLDALKREVIEAACLPNDRHVFGYTAEEAVSRPAVQRMIDNGALVPLIDRGLSHADCLAIVERAAIQLPAIYGLGFNNANCIGCCKGGEGYWNDTRDVFPADFAEVVQIQESIGPGAYLFRNRKTDERFGLKDLIPGVGGTMSSCRPARLFAPTRKRKSNVRCSQVYNSLCFSFSVFGSRTGLQLGFVSKRRKAPAGQLRLTPRLWTDSTLCLVYHQHPIVCNPLN